MTTFGYFITRELNGEELAELHAKIEAIGGTLPVASSPPIAPTLPLPEMPGNALQGWYQYGGVGIYWLNGVPMSAHNAENSEDHADVPAGLWDAVTAHFNREQWEQMVAIAFLESRFNKNVRLTTDAEDSYGAWQENMRAHPGYTPENLSTFDEQAAAAREAFDAQGYGAWWTSAGMLGLPR